MTTMKTYRSSGPRQRRASARSHRARCSTCRSAASPFVLVDVREHQEVNLGKIPGAVHVSRGNLESQDRGAGSARRPRRHLLRVGQSLGVRRRYAPDDGLLERRVDGGRHSRLGRRRRRGRMTRDVARRAPRAPDVARLARRLAERTPLRRCKRTATSATRRSRCAPSVRRRRAGAADDSPRRIRGRSVERPHRVSRRPHGSQRSRSRAHRDARDAGRRPASISRATGASSARSTTSRRARRRFRRSSSARSSPSSAAMR